MSCGNRKGDCYCYQWNCPGPLPSWEALPEEENSTALVSSTEEPSTALVSSTEEPPRRRLWVCPQGDVGKDQCDANPHYSHCCGYSVPGENCGNRRGDCYCYQWNCPGPLPSWEALPEEENSTALVSSTEEPSTALVSSTEEPPRRRLWVCPQGYVGKDQCDANPHYSHCCGYSVPGENCGNRRADCYCYQWNCPGPLPSWEALPEEENSTALVSSTEEPSTALV